MYFVCFVLVVIGSIVYSWKETEVRHRSDDDERSPPSSCLARLMTERRRRPDVADPSSLEVAMDAASGGVCSTDPNSSSGDYIFKVCPVHGTVMIPKSPASTLNRTPPIPLKFDGLLAQREDQM